MSPDVPPPDVLGALPHALLFVIFDTLLFWQVVRLGATCRNMRAVVRDYIAASGRRPEPHPLTEFMHVQRLSMRPETYAAHLPPVAAQRIRLEALVSARKAAGFFMNEGDSDGSSCGYGAILKGPFTAGGPQYLQQCVPSDCRRIHIGAIDGGMYICFGGMPKGQRVSFEPSRQTVSFEPSRQTVSFEPLQVRHTLVFEPMHPRTPAPGDTHHAPPRNGFIMPFASSWVVKYSFFFQSHREMMCPMPAFCHIAQVGDFVRDLRTCFPLFLNLFMEPIEFPRLLPGRGPDRVAIALHTVTRYLLHTGLCSPL